MGPKCSHSGRKKLWMVIHKTGISRNIQATSRQMKTYFLLVAFTLNFVGCAALDRYLEGSPSNKPTVIFDSNIHRADGDTLVILALKDVSVMIKGPRSIQLEFYLENTNKKLQIFNITDQYMSKFLPFKKMNGANLNSFLKVFTQLKSKHIFAIYLKGCTVDKEQFVNYKILRDGVYENMHPRNRKLISERKILFVLESLNKHESAIYRGLIGNTFEPYRPEEDYLS